MVRAACLTLLLLLLAAFAGVLTDPAVALIYVCFSFVLVTMIVMVVVSMLLLSHAFKSLVLHYRFCIVAIVPVVV